MDDRKNCGRADDVDRAAAWKSCTAVVIADCVAVSCCPCGVVSFLALLFFKLPWAAARKCIAGRRKKRCRRGVVVERRDIDGNSGKGRVKYGTSEVVSSLVGAGITRGDLLNDDLSAEFRAEDVWLEMFEVEYLGFFGRVSFHNKGD